jgi:hypothetical protein
MEHVTTKEAAEYVAEADDFLAATITPQHLLFNRNAIFLGGVRPHSMPAGPQARNPSPGAGAGRHQRQPQVLPGHGQRAARRAPEGSRHRLRRLLQRPRRHRDVCRGVRRRRRLDKLEAFASFNGADFYGLPRNTDTITLVKESWTPPVSFAYGEGRSSSRCALAKPCPGRCWIKNSSCKRLCSLNQRCFRSEIKKGVAQAAPFNWLLGKASVRLGQTALRRLHAQRCPAQDCLADRCGQRARGDD